MLNPILLSRSFLAPSSATLAFGARLLLRVAATAWLLWLASLVWVLCP